MTYDDRPMRPGSSRPLNIGDPIQVYAMKNIYRHMGMAAEDLVPVSRYHMAAYAGEKAVVPLNCFNMIANQGSHPYSTLPPSGQVVPVYISFHLHNMVIDKAILDNMARFGPVGCRDEETYQNLTAQGVDAYLSGCLTAALPRREREPENGKVYLVDCYDTVMECMPKALMQDAVVLSHSFLMENEGGAHLSKAASARFQAAGEARLRLYRDTAKRIITGRLHATSPCNAMGIPVVSLRNNIDGRFAWLEKLLPLYTPLDGPVEDIDWERPAAAYEEHKKVLIDLACTQVRRARQKEAGSWGAAEEAAFRALAKRVHDFYMDRPRAQYDVRCLRRLDDFAPMHLPNAQVALWGVTTDMQIVKNAIARHFPGVRVTILDQAVEGTFDGIPVQKPEALAAMPKHTLCIATARPAVAAARQRCAELGLDMVQWSKVRFQ